MRTLVTFQSSEFNTTESREYFINSGCFGDDLAKWMIERLHGRGLRTDDEPDQEDFGWFFEFEVADGKHCCVIGFRPGEDDEDEGNWIIWLEKSCGFLASLFGGRNRGLTVSAIRAIHDVLSDASEIRSIRWHERKAFDAGKEEEGSPEPDGLRHGPGGRGG